jgi:hypothetical protein
MTPPLLSLLQSASVELTPNETRATLAFVGLVIAVALWGMKVLVRVFVEMRDTGRDVHHAVFGNPTHAEPNGIVRDLGEVKRSGQRFALSFDEHVEKERAWQAETTQKLHTLSQLRADAAMAADTVASAAATAAEAILKTARRRATAVQKRQVAAKR